MKQIYIDTEKIIFDKIKSKRLNEITNLLEKKNFKEGDELIFQYNDESIKGKIRKIKKYDTIRSIIFERKLFSIEIGDVGFDKQYKIMDDIIGSENDSKLKYKLIDIDFYSEK